MDNIKNDIQILQTSTNQEERKKVITKKITWQEAISADWRKDGSWQPGWEYEID